MSNNICVALCSDSMQILLDISRAIVIFVELPEGLVFVS